MLPMTDLPENINPAFLLVSNLECQKEWKKLLYLFAKYHLTRSQIFNFFFEQ